MVLGLTRRQQQVMAMTCEGMTIRQVAAHLGIAYRTASTLKSRANSKIGGTSISHCAVLFDRACREIA